MEKIILSKIKCLLKPIIYAFNSIHVNLEDYIDKTTEEPNLRIKKKMLIYYVYTTVIYSMCLPFFNPYASLVHAILYSLLALCQLLMLKVKDYRILNIYFIVYTFLSIYLPSTKDDECLQAVAVALMHHNLLFLFPDSFSLKCVYLLGSLYFIKSTEPRVLAFVHNASEGFNSDILEGMVKNFYASWPLIYIVNHISSMYLTKNYHSAFYEYERLKKKADKLYSELEVKNAKLNEAMDLLETTNTELKEAIKTRELFIASASHELRNPLNSMIGNIELVTLDTTDSRLLKMLETCKVCGEVLLALINNVLDVAKINAEKLELHYLPGNFLKVIEKVWGISALKIRQKKLEGELYISHDFPKYIEMDGHRLMQILLNLLGNSTKFTESGFIKLVVTWHDHNDLGSLKDPHEEYIKLLKKNFKLESVENASTRPSSEEYDDINSPAGIEDDQHGDLNQEFVNRNLFPKFFSHMLACKCSHMSTFSFKSKGRKSRDRYQTKRTGIIRLELIDTGCGISENAIQHLFKPFAQADPSIAQKFGGTGLGLYITEQLITKMGGQIFIYSKEGVGTNFCVLIPTTTSSKQEMRQRSGQSGQSGTGSRRRKSSDKETNASETDPKEKTKRKSKERRGSVPKGRPNIALVVDDDPFGRSIMIGYLTRLGVTTEGAVNGQEAVEMFTNKPEGYYSFISMDLQMPTMDGFEASKKIREYEETKNVNKRVPIVVVTGNCTEKERLICLDPAGDIHAIFFGRKPFTFKDCKLAYQLVLNHNRTAGRRPIRVLAVDDDEFNTNVMKEYLSKHGIICNTSQSGKEAVEMVHEKKYNAVVMDCEMPGMDGYTAARLIKQRYPELLIIGVSGNSGEAHEAKARRSGMGMVETKPVNFVELVETLKKTAF